MCEARGGLWPSRPRLMSSHATDQFSGLVKLRPVDSVDVQIIVDNFIDILLPSRGQVIRPILQRNWSQRPALRAEHGYSLLFTFQIDGGTKSILYDAGLTPDAAVHNLEVLGLQLADVETIVLSHGHSDHHGG